MKIIGLTGGIGSGKTTVLQLFQKMGAAVFIADVEAKKLMSSNVELKKQIIALLGVEAYANGLLNRAFIASVVFKDSKKLAQLNALIHPKVRTHFLNFIQQTTAKYIVYEAAILFESGSHTLCNYIVTVTANFDDKIERLIKRDGSTKQQIIDRMQHQLNDEEKIKKAHFLITNNTLVYTKSQVKTIFNILSNLE